MSPCTAFAMPSWGLEIQQVKPFGHDGVGVVPRACVRACIHVRDLEKFHKWAGGPSAELLRWIRLHLAKARLFRSPRTPHSGASVVAKSKDDADKLMMLVIHIAKRANSSEGTAARTAHPWSTVAVPRAA